MNTDHRIWRERVLGYEDLDPDERRLADVHLRDCAECRILLAGIREREALARLEGQLPSEALALSAEDSRAEEESADTLVARLVGEGRASAVPPATLAPEPRDRRRAARALWWIPVAAAAGIAVLLWPAPRRTPPVVVGIESLAIVRQSSPRGAPDVPFRTGDPFNLRMRLSVPGVPIVIAVDDAGTPELLYPPDVKAARIWPAGDLLLPEAASGESWTFSGAPGRETFLAAAHADLALDVGALRDSLLAASRVDEERTVRLAAIRRALERFAGPVREISVRHLP